MLESGFLGGIGEYENGLLGDEMSFASWPLTFSLGAGSNDGLVPAVACKSANNASKKGRENHPSLTESILGNQIINKVKD